MISFLGLLYQITWWLKTIEKSQIKVWVGPHSLHRPLERSAPLSSSFGGCHHSWAYGCITLISVSSNGFSSFLCFPRCVIHKCILHWMWGPFLNNPGSFHLKKLNDIFRDHFSNFTQFLRIAVWAYLWGNH